MDLWATSGRLRNLDTYMSLWHSDCADSRRHHDEGREDARWHSREHEPDRWNDEVCHAAYMDGVREEERRQERLAEERAEEERHERAVAERVAEERRLAEEEATYNDHMAESDAYWADLQEQMDVEHEGVNFAQEAAAQETTTTITPDTTTPSATPLP